MVNITSEFKPPRTTRRDVWVTESASDQLELHRDYDLGISPAVPSIYT